MFNFSMLGELSKIKSWSPSLAPGSANQARIDFSAGVLGRFGRVRKAGGGERAGVVVEFSIVHVFNCWGNFQTSKIENWTI